MRSVFQVFFLVNLCFFRITQYKCNKKTKIRFVLAHFMWKNYGKC